MLLAAFALLFSGRRLKMAKQERFFAGRGSPRKKERDAAIFLACNAKAAEQKQGEKLTIPSDFCPAPIRPPPSRALLVNAHETPSPEGGDGGGQKAIRESARG